jgi:hypothetical protein
MKCPCLTSNDIGFLVCWDQHKQERNGRLYDIADIFLEFRRKKRPELVELIPELEEVSRGTEALPTEVLKLAYTGWTRLLSVPGLFTMVYDGGDERTSHEAKRSARPS